MANRYLALTLAMAAILGTTTPAFAQAEDTTTAAQPAIRADLIKMSSDVQIADLRGGHWATHATQVAVANNILALENGAFQGDRELTVGELNQAINALVVTAENVAGKGALTDLRAELGAIPQGNERVSRLVLAQSLARFLDAANKHELVALAASANTATRFKDMGAAVPPAVTTVVDKYKVMTGFPDLTFRPNVAVTRFQMAAIAKEILDDMRQAPIAQQPVEAAPTVVVVPPAEEPEPEIAAAPLTRPNFRANAPIALSWQALNYTNILSPQNGFTVIPVNGMITGYQGPVMLQGIANFRYDLYSNNLLDTEFRVGYSDLKWGMLQLIPYVGANVGLGTAIPGQTEYSTYLGATYGGTLSVMPMDNLEIWGNLGQSALMTGGRWNQNFQPMNYLNSVGTMLTNYGVGVDFYVSPNIALTVGLNNWQMPTDLYVAQTGFSGSVIDTIGGNVGVGFSF